MAKPRCNECGMELNIVTAYPDRDWSNFYCKACIEIVGRSKESVVDTSTHGGLSHPVPREHGLLMGKRGELGSALAKGLSFDFDCLEGGYIRVFNRYHGLHWSGLQSGRGHTMSSMMFAYGWPNPDPLLIAPNN